MNDAGVPDYFAELFAAGFTPGELRAVASELMFAVQVGEDFRQNMRVNLDDAVNWTPKKRAAFNDVLDRFKKDRPT